MGSADPGKEIDHLLAALPAKHLEPLWDKMAAMVPPVPNPAATPYQWTYSEVLPHLLESGRLVPEEQAERRVLMLVNPALQSPYTTDTLYAGLQLVNPGEIAPAHRHIAFAARFIISGHGFTAVEGKKMPLERGDVVLTPTWHWHDHGNESADPVIWLDILNLPLFRFIPVNFADMYESSRYPSKMCDPCEWRFPWKPVKEALDSKKTPHATYQYRNQKGAALSTTIGIQAERLAPGAATEVSQETHSFIYHCYEGKGHTVVQSPSGEEVTFRWSTSDTFVVPHWSKVRHYNEGDAPAYLMAAHDGPLLENLGLYKPDGPLS